MRTPQDVGTWTGRARDARSGDTCRRSAKAAEQLLEEMPEGSGRLVIDLTHTRRGRLGGARAP